jgi:hypothetical protein
LMVSLFISHLFGSILLFSDIEVPHLLFGKHNKLFWYSPVGTTIKTTIDIIIITVFMSIIAYLKNISIKFTSVFKLVTIGHFAYLVKLWIEIILLNSDYSIFSSSLPAHELNFGSLSNFLISLNIQSLFYFQYLTENIGLTELFLSIVFFVQLNARYGLGFKNSFELVLYGYIIPLLIWLCVVSVAILFYAKT